MIERNVVEGNYYALTALEVHTVGVERNSSSPASGQVSRLVCQNATEKRHVFARDRDSGGLIYRLHIIKHLKIVKIVQIHIASNLDANIEAGDKQVLVSLSNVGGKR